MYYASAKYVKSFHILTYGPFNNNTFVRLFVIGLVRLIS